MSQALYSAMHIACPWRGILPLPTAAPGLAEHQVVIHMASLPLADSGTSPAPEPGGHYWPTRRKRRKDPLEERIEAARQAAQELREQLERALNGEPAAPQVIGQIAQEAVRLAAVVLADTTAARVLQARLARTERELARYAVLEARRRARAAQLESFIATTSVAAYEALESAASGLLADIEAELQGEAKRLQQLIVSKLN